MQWFGNLSIRTKLILLTAVCSALALLLSCAGFIADNLRTAKSNKVEQLRTQAQMLAFNSTAVLTFHDAQSAKQLLRSLRLEPSVEFGCLYDQNGKILAGHVRDGAPRFEAPAREPSGYRFTDDGHLHLFEEVVDEGEKVGTVFLRANMQDVRQKFLGYLSVVSIVAVGALAVSIALSLKLQATISGPIVELAQAARRITTSDDYTIRVSPTTKDELGELYDAFNRMLDQVETSRSALKGAVANMSHEIRTPINAILGFTELLRQGAGNESEQERADYLNTIHTSGQHLLSLINDILDLSKIEAGQVDIEFASCSPHQIVAEVASVLRVRAREKGITLEYGWIGKIPQVISTDADRLRQMLMNLVSNAVKFTQAGGVHIVVSLEQTAPEPMLKIDVIDSGMGIPADKLDAIFNPFVQADNSVTRRFGGTGLGLAISRRIAQALGGDLTVRSEIGVGTTFTARIRTGPLDRTELVDSPSTDIGVRTPREPISQTPVSLPPARLLVVDDGDTNRKLIQVVLKRAGVHVAMAENGQIGFELATRQKFDLILMDMQMPVMDGYTATRKLREYGLQLPIIALTAHAMKGDETKCLNAGCSGYLTKPIDAELLLKTVDATLRESSPELFENSTSDARANATEPEPIELPALREGASADAALVSTLPMDDPEYREIVEEFVEKFRHQLTVMHSYRDDSKLGELARAAHWLKGSGGTAGFDVLTEQAAQLEQAAKHGQESEVEEILRELADLSARIALPAQSCDEQSGKASHSAQPPVNDSH